MTDSITRAIRRHLYAAGYSKDQATAGLAYAASTGPYTVREGYILAVSRILFTDGQLADGERFTLEDGYGPR